MKAVLESASASKFLTRVALGLFIFVRMACISPSASAQTSPDVEQGIKPYGAYSGGEFDSES